MPIYEYTCTHCQYKFEIISSIHDNNIDIKCPKCDNVAVKQVSLTSFRLKGDGWFKPSKE